MDAYRRRTLLITLRRAEKLWQGFFDDLSHAALASTELWRLEASRGPVGSSCGDHTDALTLIGGAGRGRRGP